jgi:hypothetical protein
MHATKATCSLNRLLVAGTFSAALTLTACQNLPDSQPDDQGTISLAVAAAPAGVSCLRVTTAGTSRSVARTVPITPGMTVSTNLSGLPTGSVSVTAEAFAEACAAVTAMSVATWNSDPFPVTLAAGVVQPVQLTMRQNGRISVSVDWDTSDGTGGAGGTIMTGAGGTGGTIMTGTGGAIMTGAGGFAGGIMTGAGGFAMTGSGGSTGGGCPGCARLSVPLTAANQSADAQIPVSTFDGTGATVSARVCALSAIGGEFELIAADTANNLAISSAIALSSLSSCAAGFSIVNLPLSSPPFTQGMFNAAAVDLIAVLVGSIDAGPFASPTVVQIDSITVSNNAADSFTFDASTEPLIFDPMSQPGSSLTWIGP